MQTSIKESNKCEQHVRKTRNVRRNWELCLRENHVWIKTREGSL